MMLRILARSEFATNIAGLFRKLYRASISAQQVSKSFLVTLGVGITFGFSFAYMVLNVSSYASQEYFLENARLGRLLPSHPSSKP